MPLFEAAAAAGAGSVLSDEYRMPMHGCLLPVIFNALRRKTFCDKVGSVLADAFLSNLLGIFSFKLVEVESAPKLRFRKPRKEVALEPCGMCVRITNYCVSARLNAGKRLHNALPELRISTLNGHMVNGIGKRLFRADDDKSFFCAPAA